jgi:hypothetical protein
MVLDLIAIGVGIYLLARHKKNKRERAAAYAAGQPIYNQDGSVTYPPGYQGCPTHGSTTRGFYDEKHQSRPDVSVQQQREEEVPRYTDAVVQRDQKGGMVKEPEVREVRSEKEEYVHV